MGIFDRFKGQGRHKAKDMSDAAEQKINERTGNKYSDKVNEGQEQMERRLGMPDKPEQPPT